MSKKWICCQIGAREHYAIPRVLHKASRLDALYTDIWAGAGVRKLAAASGSKFLHSYAGRFHNELKDAKVVSWNVRSFVWEARVRQMVKSANSGKKFTGFARVGECFATGVRRSLQKRGVNQDSIVFAYDTGALEILEWCRERGIKCVVGQMDPNRVEMELVQKEEGLWPGWALCDAVIPDDYVKRREKEWQVADKVVVNSEFCRSALVQQGVSQEKVAVIPLSYEVERKLNVKLPRKGLSSLRMLWLGQVILRKGIQYLIEAAKLLKDENIHIDIVGPIGISKDAIASAPHNVLFHGRALRAQASDWYGQSDVFVLPTLSDGFAITQVEAMAHGLPVVTTQCCGDVVSDGVDGFLIPPRDSISLARTLRRYIYEPKLLKEQSAAAMVKASQFTQKRFGENLLRLEAELSES